MLLLSWFEIALRNVLRGDSSVTDGFGALLCICFVYSRFVNLTDNVYRLVNWWATAVAASNFRCIWVKRS